MRRTLRTIQLVIELATVVFMIGVVYGGGPRDHPRLVGALAELGEVDDLALPPAPRERPKQRRSPRRSPTPRASSAAVCSPDTPQICNAASDCKGPVPDGATWTCVHPWWAKQTLGELKIKPTEIKVCAFGWAKGVAVPGRRPGPGTWRRQGQQRTRDELELVVRTQCRGGGCEPETLSAWLGALALRESSLRPWVTHRLSGDERANASAWAKMKTVYAKNPAYPEAERWRGRGLLGQIAAYYLHTIDAMAVPEELCDVSFATISYLQRSATVAIKQHSLGMAPTWASVAASIGTGKLRPSTRALEQVSARLRRAGVDPSAPVSAHDFGRPLPAGGAGKGGWAAVHAARSVVAAARTSRRVTPPSS